MEIIKSGLKIDFMGKAKYFVVLSLLLIAFSVYVFVGRGESRYGVDFLGGHEFIVKVEQPGGSEALRGVFSQGGFKEAVVQDFQGYDNEYTVRLGGSADPRQVRAEVTKLLSAAYPEKFEILKADFIGPTVGKELRASALVASLLALLGIMAYLAWRFEPSFAIGAVVALFHDVIISLGVFLWVGHDINMSTIAAALTVIGYSVNDTVIIFDRIREYILKRKDAELIPIFNEAISTTLSRTVITSFLTLLSVAALLVFGGGAIADLAIFLFVGIIVGTYSSIFIATPLVVVWERLRGNKHI